MQRSAELVLLAAPKLRVVELDRGESVMLALPEGASSEPPTELVLFGKGITETSKGPVLFDDQAAKDVLKAFREQGLDQLPIDVGHGMLMGGAPESHASWGWFTPKVKNGALMASGIEWTEEALDALKRRKFRFYSPAFLRDYESGRPKELINFALTNIPATKKQKPIVADQNDNDRGPAPQKESSMDLAEFLKLLGAPDASTALSRNAELTSLSTGLLALTSAKDMPGAMATLSAWKTQAETAPGLAKRVQELEAVTTNGARDTLIEKLSQEGKLAPALKEWAKTQTIEQLDAFGKVAPKSVVATAEHKEPKDGETSLATLSATEIKLCAQFGVSHEDFLKEKARLAALATVEKALEGAA